MKFTQWIDRNNNDRIKEMFENLEIKTYRDLLVGLTYMYEEYGNDNVEKFNINKVITHKYFNDIIDYNNLKEIDKKLSDLLTLYSHNTRIHYRAKVIGALYELNVVNRHIYNEETDFYTDKNGWDIVNRKDKILYQVKYGTDLVLKNTKKHLKWAKKNGYSDYTFKVLWYNNNTGRETTIEL